MSATGFDRATSDEVTDKTLSLSRALPGTMTRRRWRAAGMQFFCESMFRTNEFSERIA
ncbi:TPA: hypothetical protein RJR39_000674 [Burkholderia cenocepacia]|uniref:hypothetical protein n=1 Tax=Burkholderia TaxID=32008 RepID=UPI000AD9B7D7|nr:MULTISPECIES: hypothetical protein [Burkholderia]MBJ9926753.1 hypothetical protein [Burkholderia cenocepacia]MBL3961150.1 hypothetical protein [Burkholderia sp. KCJ3K979]MBR8197645.1 hypothetical protein [Burkholderia cenocepacia]MCA8232762.1 hypothetical protein [Burkholderia cenocepacia]HDR9804401.1 hypothetical protein [Burkholderia cenocepacia]